MFKEQEAGMPTAEVCRRHGLSPATFYKLKSKYGGMEVSEAAGLKALVRVYGKPGCISSDNGTEFTSRTILKWADQNDVLWHYIGPGKPQQNAFMSNVSADRTDLRVLSNGGFLVHRS